MVAGNYTYTYMANSSKSQLLESWLDNTRERVKSASAGVGLDKAAADKEALEMKDPNEKGVVAPKANHPGANRSMLELPPNGNNNGEANKEHNIMGTTSPNGVGQGEYPATINGYNIDEKFNSFTGPLAKMAQQLREGVAGLNANATQAPADVPVSDTVSPDMFHKLASIGAAVIGSEDGQQVVREIIARRAGEQEAALLIDSARNDLYKAAAAEQAAAAQQNQAQMQQNQAQMQQNQAQMQQEITPEMAKYASACLQAHDTWLNSFTTDFEKQAYAQGAMDGEQAAQGLAQGQEPAIDGAGEEGLSDEDIVQVIQAMAENGEIAPEEAQAVLAQLDSDPTLDEVAAILEQAVQNQEITPEDAQAIAMQLTGGGAPAPAEAPVDPEAAAAAQDGVAKTASVLNQLFA